LKRAHLSAPNVIGGMLAVLAIATAGFEMFPRRPVEVTVFSGTSTDRIAHMLYNERLVPHPLVFRIASRLSGSDTALKTGVFSLRYSLTGIPLVLAMRKPGGGLAVTIPEGFRSDQIAERMAQRRIITDPVGFMALVRSRNLEGWLFPETYRLSLGSSAEAVVERMTAELLARITPEMGRRMQELRMSTAQVVVLASIVQKEGNGPEQMQMVAGVFHNRLRASWPLESCATVRFALKKFSGTLTHQDVRQESPYNTYRRRGLPPGAICNPGMDAIRAVLYPAATDAMFFFTDDDATLQFSRYYEQHVRGRQKRRAVRGRGGT